MKTTERCGGITPNWISEEFIWGWYNQQQSDLNRSNWYWIWSKTRRAFWRQTNWILTLIQSLLIEWKQMHTEEIFSQNIIVLYSIITYTLSLCKKLLYWGETAHKTLTTSRSLTSNILCNESPIFSTS